MKTFNVYNPALSAFTILWLTLQRTTQNTWNAEDQIKIKKSNQQEQFPLSQIREVK